MNKKQLVVAWIMGVNICIALVVSLTEDLDMRNTIASIYPQFVYILCTLILGSLLIYTLRK